MNVKTVSNASNELGDNTSRTLDLTIHDEECGTVDSGSTTASGVISSPKNIEDEDILQEHKKPRILALCGAKSNDEVTKLQLEHLNITSAHYEIIYLHGTVEDAENEEMEGVVYGPFYSWFDTSDDSCINMCVVKSVKHVLEAVHTYGPFDGVYGFSQGGIIAALVTGIHEDHVLQNAINDVDISNKTFAFAHQSQDGGPNTSRFHAPHLLQDIHKVHQLANVNEPLFNFAILACSGSTLLSQGLRGIACSIHGKKVKSLASEDGQSHLVNVRSLHLVGLDDRFKAQSENISLSFMNSKVVYSPAGHAVKVANEYINKAIEEVVHEDCTKSPQKVVSEEFKDVSQVSSIEVIQKVVSEEFKDVSQVSSIATQQSKQVAWVELKHELLPTGKRGATIVDCLEAHPTNKAFLFDARNPKVASTTYGQALDFIQGGAGDLRRLGVEAGEVVAYCSPGGSAVAALAFLTISAQTTSAPFSPSMTEPDVLDALDQFNAKHLILFKGVDAPGVEDAFVRFAKDGKAAVHFAVISGPDKPGQFEFEYLTPNYSRLPPNFRRKPRLVTPAKGVSLLLRTSGTTARPKVVPLQQDSLVNNGAIIASSMQLQSTDVCYSVMPLHHIGGISASILCTISSGGSVCCDGESFDPSRMIDALAISNPQPTWYSAVPTIHNATVNHIKDHANTDPKYLRYGIQMGRWEEGHSLRMIRSGAAALLQGDAIALSETYGGIPVYPTYSMSEQMPITQPPAGKTDMTISKPGSVGVPVAASLAIVSQSHLCPLSHGHEGEIAISGETVMKCYLNNPAADAKNYFLLNGQRWFLTGDIGLIDSEGYLFLKGRAKELIKKGGEQVSPYEVESALIDHPWVNTVVCFSCPSQVFGEEVGCAIVLKEDANMYQESEVLKSLRMHLKDQKLAPNKWPTRWKLVDDDELPKTTTNKYKRIGLSEKLGLDINSAGVIGTKDFKAKIDWDVISGFRFVLACYVMFMHIGSDSWGSFALLRTYPWHVHCFFTLGGYSMASTMNPVIKKKFSYFLSRIGNLYPMYFMSLVFGLANLLVVCRPSTFDPNFHWDAQPSDESRGFFCEGTPLFKTSYWGSLVSTVVIYLVGLAVTPIWPATWWLGYYLWFNSMYFQALGIFPVLYNWLFSKTRKNLRYLLKLMFGLQALNAVIVCAIWFAMRGGPSYNHWSPDTGEQNTPSEFDNEYGSPAVKHNAIVLSIYLFAPLWILYFIIGAVLAFIYDAVHPAEKHNAYLWGYVADLMTIMQIALSVAIICQGTQTYGDISDSRYFRPSDADHYTDSLSTNRLWDNLCGRMMAPITTLWIFAMSTGHGYTAQMLRCRFLVNTLAPTSYNCFLFHQVISQWYYAVTRSGKFWNWWQFRKEFYWFSPGPCPVEWYEYFLIVGLVVFFSHFMDSTVTKWLRQAWGSMMRLLRGEQEQDDIDVAATLHGAIEKITGIEPEFDSTLDEVGLASVGLPVVVGLLNKSFSVKRSPVSITTLDLAHARTMEDIVSVIEKVRSRIDDLDSSYK